MANGTLLPNQSLLWTLLFHSLLRLHMWSDYGWFLCPIDSEVIVWPHIFTSHISFEHSDIKMTFFSEKRGKKITVWELSLLQLHSLRRSGFSSEHIKLADWNILQNYIFDCILSCILLRWISNSPQDCVSVKKNAIDELVGQGSVTSGDRTAYQFIPYMRPANRSSRPEH